MLAYHVLMPVKKSLYTFSNVLFYSEQITQQNMLGNGTNKQYSYQIFVAFDCQQRVPVT